MYRRLVEALDKDLLQHALGVYFILCCLQDEPVVTAADDGEDVANKDSIPRVEEEQEAKKSNDPGPGIVETLLPFVSKLDPK